MIGRSLIVSIGLLVYLGAILGTLWLAWEGLKAIIDVITGGAG